MINERESALPGTQYPIQVGNQRYWANSAGQVFSKSGRLLRGMRVPTTSAEKAVEPPKPAVGQIARRTSVPAGTLPAGRQYATPSAPDAAFATDPKVMKLAASLLRRISTSGKPLAAYELRKLARWSTRPLVEAALAHLVATGQVHANDGGRFVADQ